MSNISDTTPDAEPEKQVSPIAPNGADPMMPIREPEKDAEKVKAKKARIKKAKAEKEGRPPLPEHTQPAPEIPLHTKAEPQFDEDLIADDDDEGDLSKEVPPSGIRVTTRLPKAKYIRAMPRPSAVVYVIRLDEEDRRPNQIDTYIISRAMVSYVRDDLEQTVDKMIVRVVTTIQGQPRFFLHSASSGLSGNSWQSSLRELLLEAEKSWLMRRSDLTERRYRWRLRDSDLAPVEPIYPADPFKPDGDKGSLFKRSLGEALIEDRDHRICKRLRGEEEEGKGGSREADI